MASTTDTFRSLHKSGTFLMPNAWDAGSARYLANRGVAALATTSSGFAATLGRRDQQLTRDDLLRHVELLTAAIDVPLSVDSERCYADDLAGVAHTVELLAQAGAAGCSIEDYDPATGAIDDQGLATERVAAAAQEAARHGLVLTARSENLLYGAGDLDDTIARLVAYRDVGAEVLYAPGLTSLDDITRVVAEVGGPVNVLAHGGAPSVAELAEAGVRRISTGGSLAWAALRGLASAADELLDQGTYGYAAASPATKTLLAGFG